MPEIETISLSRLRTDGGTQMRGCLVKEVVEEYAGLYRAGVELPPLDVVYEAHKGRDNDVWLWDGFHRLEGAMRAGLAEVPCEITFGTLKDARLLAAGANACHGVRRDNQTKRKAIRTALAEMPSWSDRQVAEHCSVSHPLVATVRREMAEEAAHGDWKNFQSTAPGPDGAGSNGDLPKSKSGEPVRMRTGKDGRTINTANIGPGKRGGPQRPQEVDGVLLDRLGGVVPPRLEDVFCDRALPEQVERVRGWMKALQCASVEREIVKRQGHYPYVSAVGVRRQLDEAHDALQVAADLIEQNLPHAVCPRCQGTGKAPGGGSCPGCRSGCGYVTEFGLLTLRLEDQIG
jgi:hypothetical protein